MMSGTPLIATRNEEKKEETVIIRAATFSDYDDIMDMHKNVYNGFDYLSVNYFPYLHQKLCYPYVIQVNGLLVSFVMFEMLESGDTALLAAIRVRPSHQGLGFSPMKNPQLYECFKQGHPGVCREMFITTSGQHSEKKVTSSQIINRWLRTTSGSSCQDWLGIIKENFACFKLSAERRQEVETRLDDADDADISDVIQPYTQVLHLLNNTDKLEDFLQQYWQHYIAMGADWSPRLLNKESLREIIMKNNIGIIYRKNSGIVDELNDNKNEQKHIAEGKSNENAETKSEVGLVIKKEEVAEDKVQATEIEELVLDVSASEIGLEKAEHEQQKEEELVREKINSDSQQKIESLSYSSLNQNLHQEVLNIFIHTQDEDQLISHVISHLRHTLSTTSADRGVGLIIHFPLPLHYERVTQRLRDLIGEERITEDWPIGANSTQIVMGFKPM